METFLGCGGAAGGAAFAGALGGTAGGAVLGGTGSFFSGGALNLAFTSPKRSAARAMAAGVGWLFALKTSKDSLDVSARTAIH